MAIRMPGKSPRKRSNESPPHVEVYRMGVVHRLTAAYFALQDFNHEMHSVIHRIGYTVSKAARYSRAGPSEVRLPQ